MTASFQAGVGVQFIYGCGGDSVPLGSIERQISLGNLAYIKSSPCCSILNTRLQEFAKIHDEND